MGLRKEFEDGEPTMKLHDNRKRVWIALWMENISGREKLAGIYRYLNERYAGRPAWSIQLVRNRNELTPTTVRQAIAANYDGYMLSLQRIESTVAPFARIERPLVIMDVHSEELDARTERVAFFHHSPDAIGRLAAEAFADGGYRSYAFLHSSFPIYWSRERHRTFAAALAQRGLACAEFKSLDDLLELPRPAAVFAAYDIRALEAIEFVKLNGFSVPTDYSFLGVDNDPLICDHTLPRLSSIDPDYEREGYLAAQALDRLMSGEDGIEPLTTFITPRELVARDSIRVDAAAGKLVRKALTYISKHAAGSLSPQDVVDHLGCSRRLADLRFREVLNASMLEVITEHRLKAVCQHLAHRRATIESIAATCGFKDSNYLKTLFRKHYGVTMQDWRANH